MNLKKWRIPYLLLLLASVWVLLLVNTIKVVAQSNSVSQSGTRRPLSAPSSRERRVIKLKFTLPPKGAPGKRTDAGSRNECSANKPLTALVPTTNIGLTVAKRNVQLFGFIFLTNLILLLWESFNCLMKKRLLFIQPVFQLRGFRELLVLSFLNVFRGWRLVRGISGFYRLLVAQYQGKLVLW
ncbi:MAG: DUF928 domain-containing protein [Scytonematopsis contorta HA4267-MV1]|nr:DUF928 domain-containing protein [Scytonematopsis contorta HA4267-MV1]